MENWKLELGAAVSGEGTRFRVWAPRVSKIRLEIGGDCGIFPMEAEEKGYYTAWVQGLRPGARYSYLLEENRRRPDPASRFQPDGVNGPSETIDPGAFAWEDGSWKGVSPKELILYELHTGTFTPNGTFEAVIPWIDYLKSELGATAIQVMPVAQFPGSRNWGYDGVFPYAPQNSYGGPRRFKELINACHEKGLAVILDVVYNHLGPEGNYLSEFGPYFTDRYKTPWGSAVNFDGPESDEVRRFFIENALYWVTEYHVDGLRLDAIHGMFDFSAHHFLAELRERIQEQSEKLGRRVVLIAESDLNDVRVLNTSGNVRVWPGCPVERRFPPLLAHSPDRGAEQLLPGFRRPRPVGPGSSGWIRLYRPVFLLPEKEAWESFRASFPLQVHRFLPESRPDRKPLERVAAEQAGLLRGPEACRRARCAYAPYPSSVYGRRVRGRSSLHVFHPPFRPGARRGGPEGQKRRVCRVSARRRAAGPPVRSGLPGL